MTSPLESLPFEILQRIVDYLVGTNIHHSGFLNLPRSFDPPVIPKDCRQAICNLRLTSKACNAAASPALVPILRIDLDEASLARAEKITATPSLAATVVGVDLVLGYCSEALANDFKAFAEDKLDRFNQLADTCCCCPKRLDDFFTSRALSGAFDEDACEQPWYNEVGEYNVKPKDVRQAGERWEAFKQVWGNGEGIEKRTTMDRKFAADILQKGFQQFKALGQEQHDLVTTGRFATSVARILSQLPRLHGISMRDKDHKWRALERDGTVYTMLDDDAILKMVAEPVPWSFYVNPVDDDFDDMGYRPQNTVTKLLWDIPIALHRQGVSLRSLSITAFPCAAGFELGEPEVGFLGGTGAEFRDFMSSLESFHFDYFHTAIDELTMPASINIQQQTQMDDFLGACVSSNKLRSLRLDLANFSTHYDRRYFPMTGVLSHLNTDLLLSVIMHDVAFSEVELRGLLSKLGPSTRNVSLDYEIKQGEVDNVKDEILAIVGGDKNCSVHVREDSKRSYEAPSEGSSDALSEWSPDALSD